MLSMTLATLGWGSWWLAFLVERLAPGLAPNLGFVYGVAGTFAVLGLLCGAVTLRAKLAWILITGVPLFANASLLMLPCLMPEFVSWQ